MAEAYLIEGAVVQDAEDSEGYLIEGAVFQSSPAPVVGTAPTLFPTLTPALRW